MNSASIIVDGGKNTKKKELLRHLKNTEIQIYPVIRAKDGTIIDGKTRKEANPNWKETIIDVEDEFNKLRLRFLANLRKDSKTQERKEIVRVFHEKYGLGVTEIAEMLNVSHQYISKLLGSNQVATRFEQVIKAKEVYGLSDSGVEWCDYGITIYSGCYHNCRYCYARRQCERFHWLERWDNPIPKEIRWKDLQRSLEKHDKGRIFFCPACDAYQPIEKETKLARRVLEELLIPSKHLTLILTKSDLVRRDYDIIQEATNVHVGFTIIHLNDRDNTKLEPNSTLPSKRIEALEEAHESGITTFVSIEPWIPNWTDPIEIIEATEGMANYYIIGSYQYYEKEEIKREEYLSKASKLYDMLYRLKKSKEIDGFFIKEELRNFLGVNYCWSW